MTLTVKGPWSLRTIPVSCAVGDSPNRQNATHNWPGPEMDLGSHCDRRHNHGKSVLWRSITEDSGAELVAVSRVEVNVDLPQEFLRVAGCEEPCHSQRVRSWPRKQ